MAAQKSVFWVNAFTTEPYTGNPAVVIPDASDLSDEQMQRIAREMNCSETAFVLRPSDTEADFRLRWFTPTQEVALCGHATVATMHILAELGLYNLQPGFRQILYVETLSGVLPVTVDSTHPTQSHLPWIWLMLPSCDFEEVASEELYSALGLDDSAGRPSPVMDTLNRDVLVTVDSLQQLQSLQPNFNALKVLGQENQWRGFTVFSSETDSPDHSAQIRFFAPQSGIQEDPVTGSASGPLSLYLTQNNLVEGDRLILEQGYCLQRPGLIHVDLSGPTPRCGGQAVTILKGELNV